MEGEFRIPGKAGSGPEVVGLIKSKKKGVWPSGTLFFIESTG